MTLDLAAIRTYTRAITAARLAYRAQPVASHKGGALPCLAACGGHVVGTARYCQDCTGERA